MSLIRYILILNIATASCAITCGYADGDPQKPRTAAPGYDCRVDTANGLWGFCPTTVYSAYDCGLAGYCIDSHACTQGCDRFSTRTDVTTFTCEVSQFCSTVLSINGPDQSYEYIACGARAVTDRLLPASNPAPVTTTITPSSSAALSLRSSSSSAATPRSTSPVSETSSTTALSSSSSSSTTAPSPAPSKEEPNHTGAIVGGVVGGLALVCLTVLAIVLTRRKNEAKDASMSPPGHAGYSDDAHHSGEVKDTYHWHGSPAPVEMYGGQHVNAEPAELSGQEHNAAAPK